MTKEESNNVESKPPLPPSSNPAETSKQLLDKETNSEPISEEIPNEVPKNTVLNETSKEETTKVKTTVSEQDDSVLEDKMVAERNEKNEAQQRQIKSEEPAKEKMSVEVEESESVLAKEKKELKYNYGEGNVHKSHCAVVRLFIARPMKGQGVVALLRMSVRI